jgi:hypothetical protein
VPLLSITSTSRDARESKAPRRSTVVFARVTATSAPYETACTVSTSKANGAQVTEKLITSIATAPDEKCFGPVKTLYRTTPIVARITTVMRHTARYARCTNGRVRSRARLCSSPAPWPVKVSNLVKRTTAVPTPSAATVPAVIRCPGPALTKLVCSVSFDLSSNEPLEREQSACTVQPGTSWMRSRGASCIEPNRAHVLLRKATALASGKQHHTADARCAFVRANAQQHCKTQSEQHQQA